MESDRNTKKDNDQTFYFCLSSAFIIIAAIILNVRWFKLEGFQGIETIFYFILGIIIVYIGIVVIAMLPGAIIYATAKTFSISQIFTGFAIFLSVFSLVYDSNPSKYQFVTREKYDAIIQDYQEASDEAYRLDKELESYANNTPSLYRDLEFCQNEALAMYEFLKSKGYTAEDVPLDTEFLGMLEMLEKDN